MHVMIDLETMGCGPQAAIVAIGGVMFSSKGIGDEFYCLVDLESSMKAGLQVDASTVKWWLGREKAAQDALLGTGGVVEPIALERALSDLSGWVHQDDLVWGNGADFDNAILSNAYRSCHMRQPWKYINSRCYRTLKNLYPDVLPEKRTGVYHNALDDARYQARHAAKILATKML